MAVGPGPGEVTGTLALVVALATVVLHAISLGLGVVILWSAWKTLRPARGVHLAWWHVLAITVAVWGWHTWFTIRVVSDLGLFGTTDILPGTVPTWYLVGGMAYLVLGDVAFWLILKVQRGRRQLQGT
jgi:hypothetical protein